MRLIVFDLDGTLLQGNCSFAFVRYLIKKKAIPFRLLFSAVFYYLKRSLGLMELSKLHEIVFARLLQGHPLSVFTQHVQSFLDSYLHLDWYKPALIALQTAQQQGFFTMIVSSSPDFLVGPVAKRLQVDTCCATEYAVDNQGNLCHIARIMEGQEKVSAVQKQADCLHISLDEVTAYSDSIEDRALLTCVGVAIAVRPDRGLYKLCVSKGWKMI